MNFVRKAVNPCGADCVIFTPLYRFDIKYYLVNANIASTVCADNLPTIAWRMFSLALYLAKVVGFSS